MTVLSKFDSTGSGKSVNWVRDVEKGINYLNSLENWVGNEPWLASTAAELNTRYEALRKDLRENANSWSYSQSCERKARHYYHLACYFKNELYHKYEVDLESIKKYIENCLEKLGEIFEESYSGKAKQLENDAESILIEVEEIHQQQIAKYREEGPSDTSKPLLYVKRCVALGDITDIQALLQQVDQCGEEDRAGLKQKIQNIQLLRTINALEDAVTIGLSEHENTLVTAEQCLYLGQAYQLAGNSSLSKQYVETAQSLFKSMFPETKSYEDKKQRVEDIIRQEVEEHGSSVKQVKKYIKQEYSTSLSNIDHAYIEQKYIKCCGKCWLQETTNYVKKLAENNDRAIIQVMLNSLNDIHDLNQVPDPLNKLKYYKLLLEHYKLVRKEDEKRLISRFRKEVSEQILAYSDSAEKELHFLEVFVNFLNTSQNLQPIIAELELEDCCRDKLSFDKCLNKIIGLDVNTHRENHTVLQQAAKCLLQEKDLFLMDKFKKVIGAYIKPVEIQERKVDDRIVIEVSGKKIVVGEILSQLENKLSGNPNIEEVRFVGADIIHVGTNLKKEIWHGKNIAILAKTIKVHGEVVWDVSGVDNNHTYPSNAGTGEDGRGKQGADGYAGESGGNVLILAEKIEAAEKFSIISNGGNGSKGQDGGNGKDGKDGKGITKTDFDEKFPPTAKNDHTERATNILKTVTYIKENSQLLRTEWYESNRPAFLISLDVIFNENVIKEIIDDCKSTINEHNIPHRRFVTKKPFEGNIFINARTNEGNEIIFSFERGGYLTTNCQSFLLYKGSLGQPGGHGGGHGLGGQGGYAGEIIVKDSRQGSSVIKYTQDGKEGEQGLVGSCGNHGKNGWDMGYMDYSVTGFGSVWPQFYGVGENSKVKLTYHSDNSSKRIQCPYRERSGLDKYAEMEGCIIKHKKGLSLEERRNATATRQSNDRQRQARAVRKKNNISQDNMTASYSRYFNSIERNTLQNLSSDLECTKQRALQSVVDNQEQQEKQTVELGIKRHINSTYQGKKKLRSDAVNVKPSAFYITTDNEKDKSLIDELKNEQLLSDNWFQLKDIVLSHSQLKELFSNFEVLKNRSTNAQDPQDNMENSKLQDIEELLIGKYRFATLQEIAKQLPQYQEVTDNIELTAERAARYLVEAKEMDNNISHPILGPLNQYLYENDEVQSDKNSKFCEKELKGKNSDKILKQILKCFVRTFVLEVGGLGGVQREKITKICEKELQNSDEILKRFVRTFVLEVGGLVEVQQDVKDCYDKYQYFFQKQEQGLITFRESFDKVDNDCLKNESRPIVVECLEHIKKEGLLSECYRELMAYVFDINIRLYVEDQDNRLLLRDDHNSLAGQVIHVLRRGDQFIQLNIDKNYLRLEEEHEKKDDLYAKVFKEIELFEQKQEFDDYLKNKHFLSNNNPAKDEQSFNEEEDIEKIIEYFDEGEKQQLKERLEILTYIGQQAIVNNICKRFSTEGRHVSFQELCYLINSTLVSSLEDRTEQNTLCWIVAAYPQRNWIDELMLLQLENYFKKTLAEKSKWRKYLSKIENHDVLLLLSVKLDRRSSISIQCIEDILYLLSNVSNETVSLESLELSGWPYALKEKYWTYRLSKLTSWEKSENLPTASYYLLSIENTFSTSLAEKFMAILEERNEKLLPDTLTDILSNFYNEKWNLSEKVLETLSSSKLDHWNAQMSKIFPGGEERDITQLVELIKDNANTSQGISNRLAATAACVRSVADQGSRAVGKPVSNFTRDDIKKWVKEFKLHFSKKVNIGERTQFIERTRENVLAAIDRATELVKKFKFRDTQKLSVLALLKNENNTLAQVSTGEGKSLIVVAASIMKAMCGEKVDIITSSSVLAKRDAEGALKEIYNLFDINVSHNCSEDIEKRKEAYSGNQVIYGDLSNFQRDYLLDRFYGKNILGDRNFENVIVDEVDSMLLDKGNNMLYLSHDQPGLDKLESVYIYIWQWINRLARSKEELFYAFYTEAIEEAVLYNLYGLIKKEDIGKLGSELSEQQINIIWKHLINAKILDGQGKLLKENINDIELNEVLSPELNGYKHRLDYLLKECIEREKYIHVPNSLRPFIEQHLKSWINSAITAFFMQAGQDYVVDVDRSGSSPDLDPNITILDRDTGTDQANSQWDEALHQFLQLKHGCKLSLQSLKAVFISNVSFFKLYNHLYGLTGTLGSQRERDLLQEIHRVDFVTIPTAKSKQFREDKPILCTNKEEWIKRVHDEATKLTEGKKRSVLIICETVNDVEALQKAFGDDRVHTYTRDYEEFDFAKELKQGEIIIATNLAGRGTDIIITEELREAGGLHVCLTYLPNNIRIEQQAFGRAARCGHAGSGRLIIIGARGQEYTNAKILDLKKERNAEELRRISDIKAYYETQITMEESAFKTFNEQYELLNRMLLNSLRDNYMDETIVKAAVKITTDCSIYNLQDLKDKTELKEILLRSCLDKWAFWLDRNSKRIKDVKNEQGKRDFDNSLNEFISQLKNLNSNNIDDFSAWVEGNQIQMVKFGRYLCKNARHKIAINLFNEVIKQEPCFSEAAHYYKAFALGKSIDWEKKPLDKQALKELKKELREAARLFDEHSKFSINAAGVVGKIKKNNNESIIQIDAYEEQHKSLSNIYYIFLQSIDDILGHHITPQSFVNHDINEELAEVLYEDLLKEGILKKSRVKKNISGEELKTICSGYGISVETLKDVLSKYEGNKIDEKEFQKMLKKEVQLPSREAFWKLLIEQQVLSGEVKYIVVDNEKLREIDPSLLHFLTEKVAKKGLEKQTLACKGEQIFLNTERIALQQNDATSSVFEKNDFLKAVGTDKYEMLKRNGVLSSNRKARIDTSKIESATFPCYDSITLNDFPKVSIIQDEAEQVLEELVKQKVIEKKDDSINSAYRLKIKFDEIEQVQLPSCPVYEQSVKGLLSLCFTYRNALQKLMIKPHQSLFLELLEQKVIRPITVTRKTKDEDLEVRIRGIFSQTMTKAGFKLMLSQGGRITSECTEKLFNHLVKMRWIIKYNSVQSIRDDGLTNISKEHLTNALHDLYDDLYSINTPDKRQTPLNFSYGPSCKNELTELIEKTVEKVLDKRLQLTKITKKGTIKSIVRTLERSRSSLKASDVPDSKLKPLAEFCGQGEFSNVEEMYVFYLNGLDQVLQLEEKKWTLEMLCNCAIVVAMGISQILIGTLIELQSVGALTHVGAAFVSEGVSDIFYAIGALKSGYFSWKDYRQHKLESVMTSALTAGIGALLSRGAKVSRFGYKLAGYGFETGGKKLAETSGKQLIKIVGWKTISDEVGKRVALKAIEGLAFGLANAGVDLLVENCLQALCEGIASEILSDVERTVDEHKTISTRLEEAYKTLGEKRAKEMVNDLSLSAFSEENCVDKFVPFASTIVSSVTQGIAAAAKKRSTAKNRLELPINAISKMVVWSERAVHIGKIPFITGSLLDDLDQNIQERLSTERGLPKQTQGVEGYASFKKEVIGQWKSHLREQAGRVIARHIVSPILKEGANQLVRYVGKKIQEGYKSYKESGYLERFKELKQGCKDKLESVQQGSNISETESHITEEYHKDLLKLYFKTRSPKLLAALVRENIPTDGTCAYAFTKVIHSMLLQQEKGASGVTMIINGEGGTRQTFTSGEEGVTVIEVYLKDNHFELCGSDTSVNNTKNSRSKKNCLFEAARKKPKLKRCLENVSAEELRTMTADCIEHDREVHRHIAEGWHKFPGSLGLVGGDKHGEKKLRDRERVHGINHDDIKHLSESYDEWIPTTDNRLGAPEEYRELRQQELAKLGGKYENIRIVDDITLHHMMSWTRIKELLRVCAKNGDGGMDVINAYAGAAGLTDRDKTELVGFIKLKVPLDSANLIPEGFKKLVYAKFNLVLGPSKDRADDPGGSMDRFSSSKHPKDVREVSKRLEGIESVVDHVIQSEKLSKINQRKLTSCFNEIRDNFTSKNKPMGSFEENFQRNEQSGTFGRISTEGLRHARSITKHVLVVNDDEGGTFSRVYEKPPRCPSSDRDSKPTKQSRKRDASLSRNEPSADPK